MSKMQLVSENMQEEWQYEKTRKQGAMRSAFHSIGLLVTYQCNAMCAHCGPCCGPHEQDWMTLAEIKQLARQAAEMGARSIALTGGEPTLLGDNLLEILSFARGECKFSSIKMVSNGGWATSYDAAHQMLREWQDAGLNEIKISCGEFHQKQVPLQNVVNAYRAACDLNYHAALLAGEFLKEGAGQYTIRDFQEATGATPFVPELCSPYVTESHGFVCSAAMPYGRGANTIRPEDVVCLQETELTGPCSQLLSSLTAHPNGSVTACCGVMTREQSLLTVGNWRVQSMRAIWETTQKDLVLNWIRYLGLHDMKAWLCRKEPNLHFRSHYASACDLCAELINHPRCLELLLGWSKERTGDILASRLMHEASTLQAQAGKVF